MLGPVLHAIRMRPESVISLNLSLHFGRNSDLGSPFEIVTLPFIIPVLRHIHTSCRGSTLVFFRGDCFWQAEDNGCSFNITTHKMHSRSLLRWAKAVVDQDEPQPGLHVVTNTGIIRELDALPTLKNIQSLTKLTVYTTSEPRGISLLDGFGEVGSDGLGVTIGCPSLHALDLRGWSFGLEGILEVMKKRFPKQFTATKPIPELEMDISHSCRWFDLFKPQIITLDAITELRGINGVNSVRLGRVSDQLGVLTWPSFGMRILVVRHGNDGFLLPAQGFYLRTFTHRSS